MNRLKKLVNCWGLMRIMVHVGGSEYGALLPNNGNTEHYLIPGLGIGN